MFVCLQGKRVNSCLRCEKQVTIALLCDLLMTSLPPQFVGRGVNFGAKILPCLTLPVNLCKSPRVGCPAVNQCVFVLVGGSPTVTCSYMCYKGWDIQACLGNIFLLLL